MRTVLLLSDCGTHGVSRSMALRVTIILRITATRSSWTFYGGGEARENALR